MELLATILTGISVCIKYGFKSLLDVIYHISNKVIKYLILQNYQYLNLNIRYVALHLLKIAIFFLIFI